MLKTCRAIQQQLIAVLQQNEALGTELRISIQSPRQSVDGDPGLLGSPDQPFAAEQEALVRELLQLNIPFKNDALAVIDDRGLLRRDAQIGLVKAVEQSGGTLGLNGAGLEVVASFRTGQVPVPTAVIAPLIEIQPAKHKGGCVLRSLILSRFATREQCRQQQRQQQQAQRTTHQSELIFQFEPLHHRGWLGQRLAAL